MTTRKSKELLPTDIYIPFVETLFRDGTTLAVGIAAQSLLAVVVFAKTDMRAYLGIAVAIGLIGVLRLFSMRRVRRSPPLRDEAEARSRENLYILWGALHAGSLGLFCFSAIFLVPDHFAEIAALCITFGSCSSIAGRNYGSPRLVLIQLVAAILPISLGFVLRGDFFHVFLGLLLVPFFFAITRFARIVRAVLLSAISEEKKANRLAQRFNRALNTMRHGLVMLDPDGRVAVANAEAARLLAVKSPERLIGRSLHAMLLRGVAGGMLAAKDCRYVEAQLTRALREGSDRKVLVGFSNGRTYEFSAREGRQDLGVVTFEDVSGRVQAEERIRVMARFDGLTNLPNRAWFHELVSDALRGGEPDRLCALAVLDLDDFKSVNDTLGHPIGDGLIAAVAERLAAFESDCLKVSRFGGDEFLLFIDRIADRCELNAILDGVFARLTGEVDVAGHLLRIQASGGAVLVRAGEADVDGMVVRADLALYKAKEAGKNAWRLFEQSMDAAFRHRQLLKADLRSAIEARSLRVVFQPIVALDTMRIAGCEALCRWDHPELGPVSPAVFIPLAEEMGIIADISTFVLNAAAVECAAWPEPLGVSVNLSAKDFRSAEVVEKVRAALVRSGLAPHRLEIEVTETALLDDKSMAHELINAMKALGVRIALDDFGTGYSSLSYLHKLPLDKVKIDRSFLADVVQNPRALDLLKGIVDLSRPLGLAVTVEGVETFGQLQILSESIKPDLLQGFLFGSALSSSGIRTIAGAMWPFAESSPEPAQAAGA